MHGFSVSRILNYSFHNSTWGEWLPWSLLQQINDYYILHCYRPYRKKIKKRTSFKNCIIFSWSLFQVGLYLIVILKRQVSKLLQFFEILKNLPPNTTQNFFWHTVSVTPKVHAIMYHIVDFFNLDDKATKTWFFTFIRYTFIQIIK